MKKRVLIFTGIILIITVSLGIFGGIVIYKADRFEVRRVQNMAGAIVSEYPQAESIFIDAAIDEAFKYEAEGADILSSYGYDEDMHVKDQYKTLIYVYSGMIILLFLLSLGAGYGIFVYISRNQKKREKLLLCMLDDCISGDFKFIDDEKNFELLEGSALLDSLMKLAGSLRLKTARLNEERDNTKTLVTDISHQLKTPISAMKVCFDMYLEADSDSEKKEFLDRSMTQMDKLESLTAALINISRLENNMISLNPEKVHLQRLLIDVVNTEYYKASVKNIEVEAEEFKDIELFIDKKWTVEAIANIVDNGIKYSPEGSRINIKVTKMFSFVRIEIEDQGIGIPKEDRNKIFLRFFRGDSDIVKGQDGSGVGLYLTRKILEEQGGTVSVKSGGEGSTFVVQIPL